MTSAASAIPRNVSTVRTHHDDDEIREAVRMDRLRRMATYSRLYSITCDCCANDGDSDEENCEGLSVFNRNGKPCARFHGRQYRGLANPDLA